MDENGGMIGVNSLIARQARDGLAITAVNFAIKSEVVIMWLNKVGYRFASVKAVPSETEKKPVKTQVQKTKEIAEEKPAIKEPARPVKEVQSPKTKPTKERKEGKILTEKRPYNLDKLIADMQEMEDMMDEMRGKIKKYKTRR